MLINRVVEKQLKEDYTMKANQQRKASAAFATIAFFGMITIIFIMAINNL